MEATNKIRILHELNMRIFNKHDRRRGNLLFIAGSHITQYLWLRSPLEDVEMYEIGREQPDEEEKAFQSVKGRLEELLQEMEMP